MREAIDQYGAGQPAPQRPWLASLSASGLLDRVASLFTGPARAQSQPDPQRGPEAPAASRSGLPYTPVVTPDGASLPWVMKGGVKEFHLIAEQGRQEFAPGMTVNVWGYNGRTPGPTIEAVEGDRVRILVEGHEHHNAAACENAVFRPVAPEEHGWEILSSRAQAAASDVFIGQFEARIGDCEGLLEIEVTEIRQAPDLYSAQCRARSRTLSYHGTSIARRSAAPTSSSCRSTPSNDREPPPPELPARHGGLQ